MIKRLRKAIERAIDSLEAKIAYKTLTDEDIENVADDLLLDLVEADVAYDTAVEIVDRLREALRGAKVRRGESLGRVIRESLGDLLNRLIPEASIDLVAEAKRSCSQNRPLVIVFLGVNGVGKTTSIAKIANLYKKNSITPLLAAADTFRAGAQEQLAQHAERLGVPIVRGKYGASPASIAYDAVQHAKSRGYCVVLVDTAGRMHVDKDLMDELKKLVRVVKPDYKILVIDALTGNDAVEQARMFNEYIGIDGFIVTKMDADTKGGSILSIATATGRPILYVGIGQGYNDIEKFDKAKYIDGLLH